MIPSYPEATVFHSEVRHLASSYTGQDYQISVWLPPDYPDSHKSYPVLYLLDSNTLFGAAANLMLPLIWGKELPKLIIVGIGYKIQSYEDWGRWRSHDMTPTVVIEVSGSGGAEKFLEFIKAELIPYIDANYKTNTADRTITGHSYGGLFVLYTLLHEPDLFHRYCAGSPVPDYDNRVLFKYEKDLAENRLSLPVKLVVIVGGLEKEMAGVTEKFCTILSSRNYEGLELTFLVLDGESHMSVIAPLMVTGWKLVFA